MADKLTRGRSKTRIKRYTNRLLPSMARTVARRGSRFTVSFHRQAKTSLSARWLLRTHLNVRDIKIRLRLSLSGWIPREEVPTARSSLSVKGGISLLLSVIRAKIQ